MMRSVLNIAHRGGGGLKPENSMAAFRNALRLGVDAIELDVHLWMGELVVIHDEPRGGRVRPTFREVLELLAPHPTLLYAECKTLPRIYPGITRAMVRMIEEFDRVKRTIFASFDHTQIVEAKKLNRRLRTAALSSIRLHDPGRYVRQVGADIYAVGTDAIGLNSINGAIDRVTFSSCHRAKVPVWVYTVNRKSEMKKVIAAGADGIFTDYPDRLKALLTES